MENTKYNSHFLLDTTTAIDFIVDVVKFFDDKKNLCCEEIGDGNINYVFKIYDKTTNKSVVIKQADKLLRASGRPLDLNRNKIEAEILKIESELAPEFIPKIYYYDENMYALVMEDISDYKNLRKELMAGKIFKNLSEDISTFMVDVLLPTTDLVLDRADKKNKVKDFINIELCDITEDLVFTEPYLRTPIYERNKNIITEGNEDFVEKNIFSDEVLHSKVAYLRDNFMNYAECLLHGDLHSGSIFINEKGLKVIDPEFAFYGPMGYDIGNVIGNLIFSYMYKSFYDENNKEFIDYIKNTIKETVDKTYEKLNKKYDEIVTFPLYKNKIFKKDYIDKIMADSFGYAGTEIIRRTIGDSKVLELTSLEKSEKKIKMEQKLLNVGINLIKNMDTYKSGNDVLNLL